MNNEEFRETIGELQSDDVSMRALILRTWQRSPTADNRVLSYVEALLADRTPCLVSIPYQYGELRWLAAHALAQERRALGITDPVCLLGVVVPLSTEDLVAIARFANVKVRGGMDSVLAAFDDLNDRGLLPTCDVQLGLAVPDGGRYILHPASAPVPLS